MLTVNCLTNSKIRMESEIVVCIPGIWESRKELIESVIVSTKGEFMFAAGILAHPKGGDHVEVDFCDGEEQIVAAFSFGGQGKLSQATLDDLERHKSIAYLYFPNDIVSQKSRIANFTEVLSLCGGISVKLETSGIAHEWKRWFELLRSTNHFDQYCASVVLVGGENHFYSCGMHNFGLPDSQISNEGDASAAAEILNQFNYWQIIDKPVLESGHTFSLTPDSQYYRLSITGDNRHREDDLFHNSNGLWELSEV